MEKYFYQSPIGILEITYENNTVISVKINNISHIENKENKFTRLIKTELDEYFDGKRKVFSLPVNPKGTDFQKLVWRKLIKIPCGQTKSYSEIAENIGNKNAQRAVGSACNKNPVPIIIPCHRVISKSGKTGGYAYGIEIKEELLKIEKGYCDGGSK
ncbi:MAG: methylated-DNA--[protein]-cysteine S-methyltransferase [Candidatus Gastranaerophilales bacterium]|nr:methylated-DNA--[protein]-cysteine S-methyltransferase [Candidatus Gastranaerophilales bacterium]